MISDEQEQEPMRCVLQFDHDVKQAELTESATQEQAQSIYDYIKIRMNELNQILIDTQTEIDEKSIFYNWLEERAVNELAMNRPLCMLCIEKWLVFRYAFSRPVTDGACAFLFEKLAFGSIQHSISC